MDVEHIFKELIAIINEPDEETGIEPPSFHSFSNKKNIHLDVETPSDRITLIGDDKIARYFIAFQKLYKEMNVKEKLLSFDGFKSVCEQALFENKFNKIDILEIIDNMEIETFLNVVAIYGLQLEAHVKQLGKYTLVNKRFITNYLKENTEAKIFSKYSSSIERHFKSITDRDADFAFLVLENSARDNKYAYSLFEEEKNNFINIVKYIVGIKDSRMHIDSFEFGINRTARLQISSKGIMHGMNMHRKDMAVLLDHPLIISEVNGNSKIWEITKKTNLSKMDERILRAIYWVGISITETNNEVACTELAFAFEALLKQSESGGPTTSSIQGHISDMIAFMIGNNYEERKELVKKFKRFYSYRSAIAHGGTTKKEVDYFEYFIMFKKTLTTLLTIEDFFKCKTIDSLIRAVDKIKYSTAPS